MDPGLVIIGLAVIQVLTLAAMGLIARSLAGRGSEAAQRVKSVLAPANRARARALESVSLARESSERIVQRGKSLAADLSEKWRIIAHLVEEIIRPGRPAVESISEPIDRGRRLAQRLGRLHSAARKAAGSRR
jgi:hypothetical protein